MKGEHEAGIYRNAYNVLLSEKSERDRTIGKLILLLESTDAPARVLQMAYRTSDYCEGCGAPHERCGPELWVQMRSCCPDCDHKQEPRH